MAEDRVFGLKGSGWIVCGGGIVCGGRSVVEGGEQIESCDGARNLRDDDHDSDGCRRWDWWIDVGGFSSLEIRQWEVQRYSV